MRDKMINNTNIKSNKELKRRVTAEFNPHNPNYLGG